MRAAAAAAAAAGGVVAGRWLYSDRNIRGRIVPAVAAAHGSGSGSTARPLRLLVVSSNEGNNRGAGGGAVSRPELDEAVGRLLARTAGERPPDGVVVARQEANSEEREWARALGAAGFPIQVVEVCLPPADVPTAGSHTVLTVYGRDDRGGGGGSWAVLRGLGSRRALAGSGVRSSRPREGGQRTLPAAKFWLTASTAVCARVWRTWGKGLATSETSESSSLKPQGPPC